MGVPRSDAVIRADAWLLAAAQQLRVVRVTQHRADEPEARSYLGDGRLVVLRPPAGVPTPDRFAIDAERRDQPVPPRLGRAARFAGVPDFWRSWTRFEVRCKLLDRPVALALREGFDRSGGMVVLRSLDLGRVAVSLGVLLESADGDASEGPSLRA